MRWGTCVFMGLIIGGVLVGGCASGGSRPAAPAAFVPDYDSAVAAALIIQPPVAQDQPPLDIAREGRGQAAFAGFEETIFTHYYLFQDDQQQSYGRNGCRKDRFERRAIVEREGISYR